MTEIKNKILKGYWPRWWRDYNFKPFQSFPSSKKKAIKLFGSKNFVRVQIEYKEI